jgi:F-box and leucine-rich repeat protein 2/20
MLDYVIAKKISHKGLCALAANLPGMTSIDLCLTSDVTRASVTAIAELCPALVKISLTLGHQSTLDFVALNDSIFAIARGCRKLQTFSISFSNEVTDHSVAFLAGRCKELRSIKLYGCERVTDEAMKAVANRCPHLKELDIAGRSFTSEYGESFDSKITDESFVVVGQKCSTLVDISIAYNDVTDIGIAALARGCRRLRSFSANRCPSISTDGMMALSRGCRMLRTIYLADCRRISDGCLFRISEGCTKLTSFTLSSNDLVTNAGISHIARGCEKLTSITMNDCSQIDDTALIAIGSNCPNLIEISISSSGHNSQKFSDRGLITIACGCPALESISISNCPNVTYVGVKILAQNCFQLKSITFTSSKITDTSLIALATNSRKLLRVSFSYCHCITSTGLSILAAECALMQSIWFKTSKNVKKENLLSLRRKYLLANSLQNGATEHNHRTSLLSNSMQNGTTKHSHHTSVLSMFRHFISCE